jgi:CubicO group peptidase (beta-lactamase class C family)
MRSLFPAALAVMLSSASAGAEASWPSTGWTSSTPEAEGLDATALEEARDFALTAGGAGLVTRHGRVVLSWGDTNALWDVKSTTKSIGSIVLGLAIDDGLVALDDAAQDHWDLVGTVPAENTGTGWLDDITLRQLATHTAGFPDPSLPSLPVAELVDYPDASQHYGLLWWDNADGAIAGVPADTYWAWGLGESLIVVFPSLDMVVSRVGDGWQTGWSGDSTVLEPFLEPLSRAAGSVAVEPASWAGIKALYRNP